LPADEEWLDHEANTVDEQCVLDELGAASDYEHLGLKWLGESRKVTVMRLRSPFLTQWANLTTCWKYHSTPVGKTVNFCLKINYK